MDTDLGFEVPHRNAVAAIGCIDTRLLDVHAEYVDGEGGGFMVRMAGGGVSLLLARDAEAALGQFVDAYAVSPYGKIVIRSHIRCGKITAVVQQGGELHGIDPTSPQDIFNLNEMAAARVVNALYHSYQVMMPYRILVNEVVHGPNGKPASRTLAEEDFSGRMGGFSRIMDRNPELFDRIHDRTTV